jgi:hypothetical protein
MASAAMAREDTVNFGAPLALSGSTGMIGQTAQ